MDEHEVTKIKTPKKKKLQPKLYRRPRNKKSTTLHPNQISIDNRLL